MKLYVQAKTGIPSHEQRLIFGGRQLEDERSVMASGVGAWSTLHLSLRLSGGAVGSFNDLVSQRKDPFEGEWESEWSVFILQRVFELRDEQTPELDASKVIGDSSDKRKIRTLAKIRSELGLHGAFADDVFKGE